MIQKSDGGFNYDTTDMAALRYRVSERKADRIVYVTDMILQESEAEGADGKVEKKVEKIKTREGKSVKLQELLDEAKNRALKMFEERLSEDGTKM